MSQVCAVLTHRHLRRFAEVLPVEVDPVDIGFDHDVESQGVVIDDSIPHIVQLPFNACKHTTHTISNIHKPHNDYTSFKSSFIQMICNGFNDVAWLEIKFFTIQPTVLTNFHLYGKYSRDPLSRGSLNRRFI